MGKSDEYIEFAAYLRYLKKVTGGPADEREFKEKIFSRTVEKTELQTALGLVRRLAAAAVVVVLCAIGVAGLALISSSGKQRDNVSIWEKSRVENNDSKSGLKLYDAYEHSKRIREKF